MPTDRAGEGIQPGGLLSRQEARHHFATFDGPTQGQQHIKPLHRCGTTRLVLEGRLRRRCRDALSPASAHRARQPQHQIRQRQQHRHGEHVRYEERRDAAEHVLQRDG